MSANLDQHAILLVNLGSPRSASVSDVRAYLNEFLMDPYVLDIPWPVRRALVSLFILPSRPKRSAHAYQSIWTEGGSPLLVYSEALRAALAVQLNQPVWLAMRYGEPSLSRALADIVASGRKHVLLAPLYPQFADSTCTTSVAEVTSILRKLNVSLPVHTLPPFYGDAGFLDALADTARPHIANADHVLMSYHGLPERHITKADPTGTHCLKSPNCCTTESTAHATCYRHQCFATSRALAQRLDLAANQYSVSFQSRLGRLPWLQPYTDQVLSQLPANGCKRLAVICPAFVADNLETLEEIGIQGRQTFLQHGGESLALAPCLNASPTWVTALANLLTRAAAN